MIGVIDFGIGGLAVVEALRRHLPAEDLVYLADTAGFSCGNPRPDQIAAWADESAARLEAWGAGVIVWASHTIACLASILPPKGRQTPVFDVASAGTQKAAEISRRRRIGVVGSRPVVESGRHAALLRERLSGAEVVAAACPLWAALVAEGWGKRRETAMVVKRDLRPVRLRQADTLLLGSSYFTALRQLIQRKMGPQVTLVDPAEEVALRVAACLPAATAGGHSCGQDRPVRLLVTELTPAVQQAVRHVWGRPAALETVA